MSAPAGWYPDPTAPPGASTSPTPPLRWWDGANWTEHTHGGAGPTSGEWRQPGWQQPAPWGRQGGDAPGTAGYGSGSGGYQGTYDGAVRTRLLATPDGQPLGPLGLRLLARVVDYVLVSLVVVVAAWGPLSRATTALQAALREIAAAAQAGSTQAPTLQVLSDPNVADALRTVTWISLAVSAVYTILFLRFLGATPGKLLCGLRVRSWDGPGPLSWGQALLRWTSRDLLSNVPAIGPLYWVLDSLWPLWDKRRQALHDKPGRTVVVRARR